MADHSLVFYDGGCGLCHRAVRFAIAHDPDGARFRFASLDSEAFRRRVPEAARTGLPDSIVALTPDVLTLDIEMPRMDGYEFLSTIRAVPAYAALPIVMLTSRGSDKHREKATALGATGYLVKPFRDDVLIDTLTRLVQGARVAKKAV